MAEAVWDIGLYDKCMKVAKTLEERERCCTGSGGYPGPVTNGEITCVAPPADQGQPVRPSDPFAAATAGVSDDPTGAPAKPRPSLPGSAGVG